MNFRRDQIAPAELYKMACRQPRLENPEKKRFRKNMFTDEFGQQRGKVFMQHQELDTLATRKFGKKGKKAAAIAAKKLKKEETSTETL
mmetsp:Transcript_17008/g.26242  ORF Transcript_17008/g.26242 Transcript_17008/m.26242 type:complete len:88 (+) Transcript_17008:814-1077(+)